MKKKQVEEEFIMEWVGLDTYYYLRFLKMGMYISGFGTFLSLFILFPTYGTSTSTIATINNTNDPNHTIVSEQEQQ